MNSHDWPEGCSGLYDHTCEDCGILFRDEEFIGKDEPVLCEDCETNQEWPENYSQPYWKEIATKVVGNA